MHHLKKLASSQASVQTWLLSSRRLWMFTMPSGGPWSRLPATCWKWSITRLWFTFAFKACFLESYAEWKILCHLQSWSDAVAQSAQGWIEQCNMTHGPPSSRLIDGMLHDDLFFCRWYILLHCSKLQVKGEPWNI